MASPAHSLGLVPPALRAAQTTHATPFTALGLIPQLLRAVQDVGYDRPTPIQAQAIPAILRGGDLLAGAQTGTGKTAGFTLPMLQLLSAQRRTLDARGRIPIRALALTPTRELAAQVEESVRTYGKYLELTSMVMFGGVGMQPQLDALRKGVDILVATPGRLLDHHKNGNLDLSRVQIFILDEADRMLDMGFIHDIKKVLAIVPAKKQSLLFSATYSDEIKALADRLLNEPALIEVARRNATADTVKQKAHLVGRDKKRDLLAHLIKAGNWHQVLVFTRTKHGANRLTDFLNEVGISAMAIHGNKSQTARTKALADFKTNDLQVLVATDIAARGIDIDQLPHVVNFDLPNVPEDYVHRIGRTGRAGAEGEAISLVSRDEEGFLADIERLIKHPIPQEVITEFLPPHDEVAEPIVLGKRQTIGVRAAPGAGRGQPARPAPRAPFAQQPGARTEQKPRAPPAAAPAPAPAAEPAAAKTRAPRPAKTGPVPGAAALPAAPASAPRVVQLAVPGYVMPPAPPAQRQEDRAPKKPRADVAGDASMPRTGGGGGNRRHRDRGGRGQGAPAQA